MVQILISQEVMANKGIGDIILQLNLLFDLCFVLLLMG
jgi:hypothetical protein